MQVCKELCPVYHIQRCCFLCPEKECPECCSEDSNSLCEDLIEVSDNELDRLAEPILKRLKAIKEQKDKLEAEEKDLKNSLKTWMEQVNTKALNDNPYFKVTYIAASSSMTFNTDLFKKAMPDVYSKYCNKPKEVKAYIKCEEPKKKG